MKDLTLTFRISALVVVLVLALAIQSASQVIGIFRVTTTVEADGLFREFDAALTQSWEQFENGYAVTADVGNRFTARAVELEDLQAQAEVTRGHIAQLQATTKQVTSDMVTQWNAALPESEKSPVTAALKGFQTDATALLEGFEGIFSAWEAKAGFTQRKAAEKAMAAALSGMDSRVKGLNRLYQQFAEQRALALIDSQQQSLRMTLLIAASVIVAAAIFSALLLRRMRLDLKEIVSATQELANGDLTNQRQVSDANNEINDVQRAVQQMQTTLHDLFEAIHGLSDELTHSTEQLVEDGQQRLTGANQQQQQIVDIRENYQAVARGADQIGDNAKQTLASATEANRLSEKGSHIIHSAVASIGTLADRIEEAVNVIEKLDSQAENISNILTVIKSIADQTNLLALNAAIEAARAGEQGRGFAVVADEVRSLAMRTQQSTEEIQATLETLTGSTGAAVKTIQASQQASAESVRQIDEAGDIISHIHDSLSEIETTTQGTSASVEDQLQRLKALSTTIKEVEGVASINANQAQQSENMTERLRQLSGRLLDLLKVFKL